MSQDKELTVTDRFTIFEQLNMHQRCIDKGWGREQVALYNRLYWPEAKFNVNDLCTSTFEGPDGMKQMFDYAHSVFPMDKGSTPWARSKFPARLTGPKRTGDGSCPGRTSTSEPFRLAPTMTSLSVATASGSVWSAPPRPIPTGQKTCSSPSSTRRTATLRHPDRRTLVG
jgi:hypothetical protein